MKDIMKYYEIIQAWITNKPVLSIGITIAIIFLIKKIIPKLKSKRSNAVQMHKRSRKLFDLSKKKYMEGYYKTYGENGILEYSTDKVMEYGFLNKGVINKSLSPINTNKLSIAGTLGTDTALNAKTYGKEYRKYLRENKKRIPVSFLYEKENIKNKTLFVYVEQVLGNVATIIDSTAVYDLDLQGIYSIAGNYVLINITKKGEDIKVNYIYNDYR